MGHYGDLREVAWKIDNRTSLYPRRYVGILFRDFPVAKILILGKDLSISPRTQRKRNVYINNIIFFVNKCFHSFEF